MESSNSIIPGALRRHEPDLLNEWIREQVGRTGQRGPQLREGELRDQCTEFLSLLTEATQGGEVTDVLAPRFEAVRAMLERLSRSRGEAGFSPSQTATFVFTLKRPLLALLRRELGQDPEGLFREVQAAGDLVDQLGLYTFETYQRARESVIARQQSEMLELSTPVVKLWEGVLALPLIGTLDSERTQVVMETLLHRIVETGSEVAIIDITGVPTVDTLVAQHLMKTVAAARLMGVECIVSGVRPQIAQTIVHLGVALGEVPTRATLASAFKLALRLVGRDVGTPGRDHHGARGRDGANGRDPDGGEAWSGSRS